MQQSLSNDTGRRIFQGPRGQTLLGNWRFEGTGDAHFVLCDDAAWPDVPRTQQPNVSQCRIVPYRNGDEEGMSGGAALETIHLAQVLAAT